jgi:transposase
MPNHPLSLATHHTKNELQFLWKKTKVPNEKLKLRLLWKLRSEEDSDTVLAMLPEKAAESLGMSADWARRAIRAYNTEGIKSISDGRKMNHRPKIVSDIQIEVLKTQVTSGTSLDGGLWTGPKVANYLGTLLGKKVSNVTGWNYLVSMGFSLQVPRPAHEKRATKEEQEAFKKNSLSFMKKPKQRILEKPSKSGQKTKLA